MSYTNYSKWDKLDVSDDEKDYHPNIDSSLMIRIKREQRAKREQEEDERIKMLLAENTPESLQRAKRIQENRKLHINNICRVVDEKTVINKPNPNSSGKSRSNDELEEDEFQAYVLENKLDLDYFIGIPTLEETQKFVFQHPKLIDENGASYVLLQLLELELSNMRQKMVHATQQYLILRNIVDLQKEAHYSKEPRFFAELFFKTIFNDVEKKSTLKKEAELFSVNIVKRAEQKRIEMAELGEDDEEEGEEIEEEEEGTVHAEEEQEIAKD
jgi:Cdc37 N terminal kinase binding/Cdc37 Hsp90 binding domain